MATTPEYGIRYPSGGDDVDIATSLQNLALDVEGAMNDNLLPATGGTLTGPITVPYGNTGGIHIGGSGPQILSGTGSPEGVVTAPVGSQWTDTAATTGAVSWIKASGSGNTGWKVAYGNTGGRNMAAVSMLNSWTVASTATLRRVNSEVRLDFTLSDASATADTAYRLPSGLRPANTFWGTVSTSTASFTESCAFYITTAGDIRIAGYTACSGTYYIGATFPTDDAWPSVLPGT